MFERACLETSGDQPAFEQVMAEAGGVRDATPVPVFEGAEASLVYAIDGLSVRLETFVAVHEWVDAPPSGQDLRVLLATGRDGRNPVPQVLKSAPATSLCMVTFHQDEGDLMPELERVIVDTRSLAEVGSELDFQTHIWRIDGPRLVHVQYVRADSQRDEPGTRSSLSAAFRLP